MISLSIPETILFSLLLVLMLSLGISGLIGMFKKELYLPVDYTFSVKRYSGKRAIFWGFLYFLVMGLMPVGAFFLIFKPYRGYKIAAFSIAMFLLSSIFGHFIWRINKWMGNNRITEYRG